VREVESNFFLSDFIKSFAAILSYSSFNDVGEDDGDIDDVAVAEIKRDEDEEAPIEEDVMDALKSPSIEFRSEERSGNPSEPNGGEFEDDERVFF
jgi:hypothetical protein